MSVPHYREEVLNVYLAELLRDRGIVSTPESITTQGKKKTRKMPDVVVRFAGLRVMLEGKVDDDPQAHANALAAARSRIEQGVAQIGVAVVYPGALRSVSDVKAALSQASLDVAVVTESGDTGYVRGTVGYLQSALNSAFEHLVAEDVVSAAVKTLDAGIERFADSILDKKGVVARLADVLQLAEPAGAKEKSQHASATAHISGLVITNAMMFEEILAESSAKIHPLHWVESQPDIVGAFVQHWQFILTDINYFPVFNLARELLLSLGSGQNMDAFQALVDAAKSIVREKAALRHDLMGRVYHRLLADAKYLGTYYTSVPAATILLRLALQPEAWPVDWSDIEAIESFRLADLSCGTGTLLMAAADAVADNYISATVLAGDNIELEILHKVLLESVIHGYDVLSSAVHLTASTLAMRSPETVFGKMNLIAVPLGGQEHALGSIEFLRGAQYALPGFQDMFGAVRQGKRVTGTASETEKVPRPPRLDFCAMNPPFTRSVGGNLLFGSSPQKEREAMQSSLQTLIRTQNISASITAGLASVFVALADEYLKLGGRVALVLPKAVISGQAWGKTRQLFRDKYQVEVIVASHDPAQWNFSESTSLSEVLLIARKLKEEAKASGERLTLGQEGQTVAINLWQNPQTAFHALATVQAIRDEKPSTMAARGGTTSLRVGSEKVGEMTSFAWEQLSNWSSWMLPCAFAQTDLVRAAYHLQRGKLRLPGYGQVTGVPLVQLRMLGELGPDRRDIYDGFELTSEKTAYAAFWGHEADTVQTIAQPVKHHLSPLSQARKGRSLRNPEQLWPRAGQILLAERLWLFTQRVVAIRLPQKALSNVWWSFAPKKQVGETLEKVLTLWLNSTLGLLILLANRDETRGAWVDFKKPTLYALPVLDLLSLAPEQTAVLADVYDEVRHLPLGSLRDMAVDPVRERVDAGIAQALGLPDFGILRELLAQEPVICLQQL